MVVPYSTWDVAGTFVCQSATALVMATFIEPGLEMVRLEMLFFFFSSMSPAQPLNHTLLAASNVPASKSKARLRAVCGAPGQSAGVLIFPPVTALS